MSIFQSSPSSAAAVAPSDLRLRVGSWNVLANCNALPRMWPYILDPVALRWANRKTKLLNEIARLNVRNPCGATDLRGWMAP